MEVPDKGKLYRGGVFNINDHESSLSKRMGIFVVRLEATKTPDGSGGSGPEQMRSFAELVVTFADLSFTQNLLHRVGSTLQLHSIQHHLHRGYEELLLLLGKFCRSERLHVVGTGRGVGELLDFLDLQVPVGVSDDVIDGDRFVGRFNSRSDCRGGNL